MNDDRPLGAFDFKFDFAVGRSREEVYERLLRLILAGVVVSTDENHCFPSPAHDPLGAAALREVDESVKPCPGFFKFPTVS